MNISFSESEASHEMYSKSPLKQKNQVCNCSLLVDMRSMTSNLDSLSQHILPPINEDISDLIQANSNVQITWLLSGNSNNFGCMLPSVATWVSQLHELLLPKQSTITRFLVKETALCLDSLSPESNMIRILDDFQHVQCLNQLLVLSPDVGYRQILSNSNVGHVFARHLVLVDGTAQGSIPNARHNAVQPVAKMSTSNPNLGQGPMGSSAWKLQITNSLNYLPFLIVQSEESNFHFSVDGNVCHADMASLVANSQQLNIRILGPMYSAYIMANSQDQDFCVSRLKAILKHAVSEWGLDSFGLELSFLVCKCDSEPKTRWENFIRLAHGQMMAECMPAQEMSHASRPRHQSATFHEISNLIKIYGTRNTSRRSYSILSSALGSLIKYHIDTLGQKPRSILRQFVSSGRLQMQGNGGGEKIILKD